MVIHLIGVNFHALHSEMVAHMHTRVRSPGPRPVLRAACCVLRGGGTHGGKGGGEMPTGWVGKSATEIHVDTYIMHPYTPCKLMTEGPTVKSTYLVNAELTQNMKGCSSKQELRYNLKHKTAGSPAPVCTPRRSSIRQGSLSTRGLRLRK